MDNKPIQKIFISIGLWKPSILILFIYLQMRLKMIANKIKHKLYTININIASIHDK